MKDSKSELISLAKKIGERGLTTSTGGNISTRLPDGGVVITPNKRHRTMADLGIGDLSVVGPMGELLVGPRPSVELPMHMAIYSAEPSASWVVHAHPPMAIAYATEGILPETSVIEGSELKMSSVGRETPGSEALAKTVASVIGKGSNCVFLEAHGVVLVAAEAYEAYLLLEEVENACKADLARKILKMSKDR
jgi:L-fuculose-phosphate aldolase